MFPVNYFPVAYFPAGYFPKTGVEADIITSKFVEYSETQDETLLRKWGRTALSSMTDGEKKWCKANEISPSSTAAEKKWAHKII